MHSLYSTILGWFMTIVFGLALLPVWILIGGLIYLAIRANLLQDQDAARLGVYTLSSIGSIYGSSEVAGLTLLVLFFMFLVGIALIRLGMKVTMRGVQVFKDKEKNIVYAKE